MKQHTPWILTLVLGCASSGGPVAPEATPAEPAAAAAPATPAATASPAAPAMPIQDRPDMEWWRQSMKDREQRIAWFRQARFGMFVHWGAYSHLGGIWNGEPVEGYAEHIMRKQKIPSAVYQEKLAAPFNPTEFNADEWMANAKKAGMAYFIITSKHHDGFAMFDSQVSDYNVVKVSAWKHDPMKDLKAAAQKHGIKFGFYYSQAWEWHHPDCARQRLGAGEPGRRPPAVRPALLGDQSRAGHQGATVRRRQGDPPAEGADRQVRPRHHLVRHARGGCRPRRTCGC